MKKYDLLSNKAENFMANNEIEKNLSTALSLSKNEAYLKEVIEKARQAKGLSPIEATSLLLSNFEMINQSILEIAQTIKEDYYGNRIVLFAPLYLSNYCVNSCTYCPYHISNKTMPRKKMTQTEIKQEIYALLEMGHKRLALELGEDPVHNPISYVLESIETIYSIIHSSGEIRRVNVNIAATSAENYKLLQQAEIGTYILFQETYNQKNYELLHPRGPKSDYAYHTEAMDRAITGGLEDVGLGVLFGLHNYAYEFMGLLMHSLHLEKTYGIGPHTISVPRLCPADGIDVNSFSNALPDDIFLKIIALLRISIPYTGLIISTREKSLVREKALSLGISQISGGSKTTVGGYSVYSNPKDTAQFDISDNRTLDEIVYWLMKNGHIPSFCTSCYGKHRQGEDFMKICKSKQISQFCTPNALLTLQEYLNNYASKETKDLGIELLKKELQKISGVRKTIIENRLKHLNQTGNVVFF
ncbi:MAG: [Alphaproteobacteria bacterium]|nr:[FeFe] hydrogenase H-cluster radical SAM maturase HydG [Alphaproteobacteria bacterium]